MIILLAMAALLFCVADLRGLWEVDESRYAEMAREMEESGDWITPTLNYVKYFEKPVFSLWLMAAGFKLFGVSELSARLMPAVCTLLTVYCVYFLGRGMWGRKAGFLSGLVLSSCLMFIAASQIILVDMPLCMGICLAILGAWCAREARGHGLYLFWGGMAIGFLSKGVLGIGLPCLLIIAYALCAREYLFLKKLIKLKGIILFILISAPWYVLVCRHNPEFAAFFFHEHWERLLTNNHSRWQPPYFYLGVVPAAFLPWFFLFPWALTRLWPGGKELLSMANRDLLWTGLWFLLFFLFFSASNSKLIHYALPIIPPMALLTGRALQLELERGVASRFLSGSLFSLALFCLAVGAALPVVANRLIQLQHFASTSPGILLPMAFIAICFVIYRLRLRPWAVLISPLVVALAFTACAVFVARDMDNWMSVKNIVKLIAGDMEKRDIVVAYNDHHYGLAYYAKRRKVIALNWGELEFGRNLDPDRNKWFLANNEELLRLFTSGQRVWVLCSLENYPRLMEALKAVPAKLVFERARQGRWVIVANHNYGEQTLKLVHHKRRAPG